MNSCLFNPPNQNSGHLCLQAVCIPLTWILFGCGRSTRSGSQVILEISVGYWYVYQGSIKPKLWFWYHLMNLCVLDIQPKHRNVSAIDINFPHWHNTGSEKPSCCNRRTHLYYIVFTMRADVLVTLPSAGHQQPRCRPSYDVLTRFPHVKG